MPTRPSSRGTKGSLRLVRVLCSCRATAGRVRGGGGRNRLVTPPRGSPGPAGGGGGGGGAAPPAAAAEAEAVGGLGRDPDPGRFQAEGAGQVGRHLAGQVAEAGAVARPRHVPVGLR